MRPATVRMRRGGLARKQTEALARERLAQRLDALAKRRLAQNPAEWDYWFALLIITVLAFITRFWGISHPDEVVFDEVWVGKVNLYGPCKNPQNCSNSKVQTVCLILS